MKRLTVISMLVMSAAALCVNASDYLYFHKNGEVVHRLPAQNAERIVMNADKSLDALDAEGKTVYTFTASDIDSITFLSPMPKADLLNVVFKADGTAEDVSPMKFNVERGGSATTEWSDLINRHVARLTGNNWGNSNVAENFYRIDYTDNKKFQDALADGHTLEVMFMPEYTGSIPNVEAKVFASHEGGGTGIMVKAGWSGHNALNSLTFLPNVSTSNTSSWQWADSDVVPESNAYYHIVGVWDKDRKKARIYVNGRLKNEIDINGDNYIAPKTGATKFCIGGDACPVSDSKYTGVQNGVNGTVVLARIYDDALTEEQAVRLYQAVDRFVDTTRPLVENVTLLENVQVKGNAIYPVYGEGFETDDVIEFESGSTLWEIPVTVKNAGRVDVVLPDDVRSGTFNVTLRRGDRRQKLGSVAFLKVRKFGNKSQIIAHRGYWSKAGAAKNSREALRNAIELKAYGAETDVWLTKDNILVINHDPSIDGVTIQDSGYDEVKNKTLSNGETLPTFADYLDILGLSR